MYPRRFRAIVHTAALALTSERKLLLEMSPSRHDIHVTREVHVRYTAFLSSHDIPRRCKDHSTVVVWFMRDLVMDELSTISDLQ